jgi:dihydrofolate reductase
VTVGSIVVTEFMTLDGVVEAPGGEFQPDGKTGWVEPHFTPELGAFKLNELMAADALLLGRRTYEQFARAWTSRTDEQGFADRMNALPKHVASTSLEAPLEWNATLLGEDFPRAVADVKRQYSRDILVCGSADLVHTLARHDLVDEYRLMLFPVLLGGGRRLFREGSPSIPLTLARTVQLEGGVVVHSYEPVRSA